jgi:CheY-like chemotaxis protein/HPt (histidine-containing phosphotransfer) domain-containing protein
VLVAEDNQVNQKVVARMIGQLGHRVDLVANGLEAVEAYGRGGYDLILMDCRMPEMDGFEATRSIRRAEADAGEGRRVPIVALTANALASDRERCRRAGMDDHLAKPVRLDDVRTLIDRWLSAATSPGRGTDRATPLAEAPMPEIPLVDAAVIDDLRLLGEPGLPDPVGELVDLFRADAPSGFDAIVAAAGAGDAAALVRAAHALRGGAASIGVARVAACAASIERHAREGDLEAARVAIVRLDVALAESLVRLAELTAA